MNRVVQLKKMAVDYGFDVDFINSIKVEIDMADEYGFMSGVLGKYLPFQKKIILFDEDVKSIYPTYQHELVHALQNREFEKRYGKVLGVLLYWLALTFLRRRIEKDAYEHEDRILDRYDHEASQPLKGK